MKTSQRHHLKENEFALLVGQATAWTTQHRRALTFVVVAVAVVAIAAASLLAWQRSIDRNARQLLAEAMVVQEARVVPPAEALEGATPTTPQAGTYATQQAKLEAALPKFLAAADAYPATDPGLTARYHAAATLVELGRFDEAIVQYDRVIAEEDGLLGRMARLGKAESQLRSQQFDGAIATFKELSERTDSNLPAEALLLELARAYKLAGRVDDARKTLNQIVEQHADSPFAAEARQQLERLQG